MITLTCLQWKTFQKGRVGYESRPITDDAPRSAWNKIAHHMLRQTGVIFFIDVSGSVVQGGRFVDAATALTLAHLAEIVNTMCVSARVYYYDDTLRSVFDWEPTNPQRFAFNLDKVGSGGGSNAMEVLRRSGPAIDRTVILVSDGNDQFGDEKPFAQPVIMVMPSQSETIGDRRWPVWADYVYYARYSAA